jgi:hypothetical protein
VPRQAHENLLVSNDESCTSWSKADVDHLRNAMGVIDPTYWSII